jgi:hypothetical protein
MHDKVSSMLNGPAEIRRSKGVINNESRSNFPRDFRAGGDIANLEERV